LNKGAEPVVDEVLWAQKLFLPMEQALDEELRPVASPCFPN